MRKRGIPPARTLKFRQASRPTLGRIAVAFEAEIRRIGICRRLPDVCARAVTPDEYCRRKASPAGSSLYYGVRVLPPAKQQAMVAVHAFCREVREVLHEVADPRVARLKLDWWRTEIDAAAEGRAQHPVAQALMPALATFDLPRDRLDAVIGGVMADLERPAYPDFAALEEHCRNVAGNVWLLCAAIAGGADAATRLYGSELGVALRLTAIIRNLGAELRRGRLYLPRDELERFGVDADDLWRRQAPPGFAALMSHQTGRARARYATALTALSPTARRAQRPGLIVAAIGAALLDEIERDGFRVLDRHIALTPLAKVWAAWKASR